MSQSEPEIIEKCFTIENLAASTGMSQSYWRKAIQDRKIRVERFGRSIRITQSALDAFRAGGRPLEPVE